MFHGGDVIDDVTGWPENCLLNLGEAGCGSKNASAIYLFNKCKYNRISSTYMAEEDLNK